MARGGKADGGGGTPVVVAVGFAHSQVGNGGVVVVVGLWLGRFLPLQWM